MKEIPAPTKKRLILLERLLADYKEERITSQKIQSITGWTSAVVRRDFYLLISSRFIPVWMAAALMVQVFALRQDLIQT